MDAETRRARAYIWLVDYLLPLPLTAVMYLLWEARSGSAVFAAYTLALGLAFGYLVAGVGTNLLGLWRFTGPLRVGNYFLHHGFMYAPYMSFFLYITFGEWGTPGPVQAATIVACTALTQGLLSPSTTSTFAARVNTSLPRRRNEEIPQARHQIRAQVQGATFKDSSGSLS